LAREKMSEMIRSNSTVLYDLPKAMIHVRIK
jgi:hypothetical protein